MKVTPLPALVLPASPSIVTKAGVDVSTDYLDLDFHPVPGPKRFENTAKGVKALIKLLGKANPYCIVVESTGGYERLVLNAMVDAGFRVVHVDPRRVRAYAKALGIHLKNDSVDALLLARFGEINGLRFLPPRDPAVEGIKAMAVRRDQLIRSRSAEKCRVQQTVDPDAVASIQKSIQVIDRMIDDVHASIDRQIQSHPRSKTLYDILIGIKGIGCPTARILTAMLPQIGTLSDKSLNSLVGVAPYDNDSGNSTGIRRITGGRAAVRSALYACCIAGLRNTPELKTYYARLRLAGLPHNSSMMACIRKLIAHTNRTVKAAMKSQIQPLAQPLPGLPA